VGWGTAVVFVRQADPDLDVAGLYLCGAGLGAMTGVLLARRDVAVDLLGLATTIAAGGAVLAFEPRWSSVLGEARTYALLVGAVALTSIARAVVARDVS
jgi:hypothetical protein